MVKAFGYNANGGPEVAEFLELDPPSPMAGELLIDVRAAGVNPIDYKLRAGAYGPTDPSAFPVVLGAEASGVVREVGADVEGFSVGDEVFGAVAPGSGGYTEATLLTADVSAPKPPQVSFEAAATLTVAAATAYDGVTQLGLRAGQTLLVNGASAGVGVAALQIARDLEINAIGVAGPDKGPLIESLGATFISYDDDVADQVRQVLPDGVDAIFDLVGGHGLRVVAELLNDRSKLISAADMGTVSELGGHLIQRDRGRRVLEIVAGLVADGKLDPKVEDVRPLDEAAQALAAVEVGHARGKVVIVPA
ncbi:NADP-dependent oxidoreductase [Jatrophihabitans telluris]|uniref:NADP-dependent oxidoreductase n=1 Tax=Jatrophihabitans telluris TaxID=2038343 RepID=A0ABY4R0G8_9ACTN|nr:NADP-dependent oxidoreductase [Jatrophihabitans telluris]UQX88650.1 NADP-dependent oxidoreductase [Jatrophihabitans telluris]